MSSSAATMDPGPGACLSEGAVQRLIDGTVESSERERALAHIDACDECRVVATAAADIFDVPPAVAGRYALREVIGRGAMGVVWRAHDGVLDREVALKLLRVEDDSAIALEQLAVRLARESKAMAQLDHPNVVRVYDAGDDEGRFFVAMQLVEGSSLRDVIANGDLSTEAIVALYLQAADGLQAAHALGIVHRDFKPDNVIVDDRGTAKVVDFGLARSLGTDASLPPEAGSWVHAAAHPLTAGAGVGTPGYMPPEQFRGGDADPRSDVFSFCASLWEALYGVRPFTETSLEARLAAIDSGDLVTGEGRIVPRRIRSALAAGLASDPAQRPASFAELRAKLLIAPPRRDPSSRWPWVAALGIVVAAGAFQLARTDQIHPACEPPDDRLAAAWSADKREEVRLAVLAQPDGVRADLMWSTGAQAIGETIADFDQEWVQTCRDEASGEIERAMAARRFECLAAHRVMAATMLERAAEGELAALHGANVQEPARWCRALSRETVDLWPTSNLLESMAVIETQAEVGALLKLGHLDEAEALGRSLLPRAARLDAPALLARAKFHYGRTLMGPGRGVAAMRDAALTSPEPVTRASAWFAAASEATGDEQRRYLELAKGAVAEIEAPEVSARVRILILNLEGSLLLEAGETEAARTLIEESRALAHRWVPRLISYTLVNSSRARWAAGQLEAALESATAVAEHLRGQPVLLPHQLGALRHQLGLELELGHWHDASSTLARAEALCEGATADACPRTLPVLRVAAALRQGELDQAEAHLAELRPDSDDIELDPRLACLDGMLHLRRGEPERAEPLLRAAVARMPAAPILPIDGLDARTALAEAMRQNGAPADALGLLEAELAGARWSHALPQRGRMLAAKARALHDLGEYDAARRTLEAALERLTNPDELSDARTRLAGRG